MNTFDNESVRRISAAVRHVEGALAESDFRPVDPVAPKVVAALKITAIAIGETPAQAQVVTYDTAGDSWLVVSSAVEILGESLTVDEIVHGMLIGYRASTKKAVYLASTGVAPLDSIYLPLVTKVCLSGLPATVVPDGGYGYPFDEDDSGSDETITDTQDGASLTVERRVVTLPGDTPIGPPVCIVDPDDCCEEETVWPPDYPMSDPAFVRTGCCDNRQISVEATATIEVTSGTSACLDGRVIDLDYVSGNGQWESGVGSGSLICTPAGGGPSRTFSLVATMACLWPGCDDSCPDFAGWPAPSGWYGYLLGVPVPLGDFAWGAITPTGGALTSCDPLTFYIDADWFAVEDNSPITVRITWTATTEA
jgi:hypothetical protein